ncbi:unnamed protein product [Merluccius merluccius]
MDVNNNNNNSNNETRQRGGGLTSQRHEERSQGVPSLTQPVPSPRGPRLAVASVSAGRTALSVRASEAPPPEPAPMYSLFLPALLISYIRVHLPVPAAAAAKVVRVHVRSCPRLSVIRADGDVSFKDGNRVSNRSGEKGDNEALPPATRCTFHRG